ncbi:putative uncharacterized protein DDB_G0274435 [Odontomachus brunneus]|uniref:putative uncharacterized protein DDB_G0274435 n=1 Tax=Odontomachus brunneus TaxID=486640 RepID=UPI0013F183DE|nr:putative uncharacterized protein DDB_G0274435 [Odontomachus brunneus]
MSWRGPYVLRTSPGRPRDVPCKICVLFGEEIRVSSELNDRPTVFCISAADVSARNASASVSSSPRPVSGDPSDRRVSVDAVASSAIPSLPERVTRSRAISSLTRSRILFSRCVLEAPSEEADEMKANTAATKIQANFRGYRVRKQLKESSTSQRRRQQPSQQQQQQQSKKIQQHQRDQQHQRESREQSKPKDAFLKRQNTREALEEKSATKIQAGIRGFLVRKRQQAVQAAATRIQAGFRGFRTRKLLKQNGQ